MFCGQPAEKDFPMFLLTWVAYLLRMSEASSFLFSLGPIAGYDCGLASCRVLHIWRKRNCLCVDTIERSALCWVSVVCSLELDLPVAFSCVCELSIA